HITRVDPWDVVHKARRHRLVQQQQRYVLSSPTVPRPLRIPHVQHARTKGMIPILRKPHLVTDRIGNVAVPGGEHMPPGNQRATTPVNLRPIRSDVRKADHRTDDAFRFGQVFGPRSIVNTIVPTNLLLHGPKFLTRGPLSAATGEHPKCSCYNDAFDALPRLRPHRPPPGRLVYLPLPPNR